MALRTFSNLNITKDYGDVEIDDTELEPMLDAHYKGWREEHGTVGAAVDAATGESWSGLLMAVADWSEKHGDGVQNEDVEVDSWDLSEDEDDEEDEEEDEDDTTE